MASAQRTNPAPALYAAAVAVLAYGVAMAAFFNIDGGTSPAQFVAMIVALVSVVSAAIGLAVVSEDSGPVLTIIAAIGGTIIALDVALDVSIVALNFPSNYSDNIDTGELIAAGVGVVLTVIAGLALAGALATCRRYFTNTNPYFIVISVIVVNAIVVSVASAFSGLNPDADFGISDRGFYRVPVDGGVFFGLGGDIESAVITAIFSIAFPVAFVAGATFISATAAWRRLSSERIARAISVTTIGISVFAAVIAVLVATIGVVDGVAGAEANEARWGLDLDVVSAVVAGLVAFLGCSVVTGLAGVVACWYQALKGRRQI